MQNCADRDLRKQMWDAYTSRCNGGEFDNTKIIDTLTNLRLERANILGFPTHADYVLDDCLAKTPEAVNQCLMQIWTPALAKAKQECAEYQKMIKADDPAAKLQPWDWRYYSEKLRKAKYDLDDDVVRPYFSLDNVREGAFATANKLYGITFRENDTLPTYNKEAHSYEVLDGGQVIGILYMDFFPRASKRSGAWMTEFRGQKVNQRGRERHPHHPGGLQLHQAHGRQALAAQLRRERDPLPRVRPCPPRPAEQVPLSFAGRHQCAARLCGAALAGHGELVPQPAGDEDLRQATTRPARPSPTP